MKESIMRHKILHIEQVNQRSTYNKIKLKSKYVANVSSNKLLMDNFNGDSHQKKFGERIEGIDNEMKEIDRQLSDFVGVVSGDFTGIIGRTNMVKQHMSLIK